MPFLSDRFTLYAVDLPGFGKTPLPRRWNDSLFDTVDAVIGFLDAKKIAKVSLVGNSMGGGLSLAICEAHPERVEDIVLLNPYGLPSLPMAVKSAKAAMGRLLPYLLRKSALRQCAKGIFSRALFDKNHLTEHVLAQTIAPFASFKQRTDLFRFLRAISAEAIASIDTKLPEISRPVLILWGMEDRWLSQDHWMHLVKRLPNAKVERIPACGHLPQFEKPEVVARAIRAFLSESPLA